MNEIFAGLYEGVFRYYKDSFSADMYQESLYGTVGMTMVGSCLFFFFLFYYIINRPAFSHWYHWLIILALNLVVCFCCAYFIPKDHFDTFFSGNDPYSYDIYVGFALTNTLAAALTFILFSFLGRWWSTNCKRTPIPH